ncbi:hypothetical protein D187_005928 [Cystobacter fuscus DSM 2262]|uniref:Uncharacterized protein n=1 Tax=Cystobacter fuscus (strain ATCC 25194 / DSM 2262 / NBRC 100088 / M29) TaxID=1242864 RepID=S9PM34_CYSF2|nr:hypothetical protein D187_005928 [Cystobacter fuscus DSM 2262]
MAPLLRIHGHSSAVTLPCAWSARRVRRRSRGGTGNPGSPGSAFFYGVKCTTGIAVCPQRIRRQSEKLIFGGCVRLTTSLSEIVQRECSHHEADRERSSSFCFLTFI